MESSAVERCCASAESEARWVAVVSIDAVSQASSSEATSTVQDSKYRPVRRRAKPCDSPGSARRVPPVSLRSRARPTLPLRLSSKTIAAAVPCPANFHAWTGSSFEQVNHLAITSRRENPNRALFRAYMLRIPAAKLFALSRVLLSLHDFVSVMLTRRPTRLVNS